MQQQSSGPIGLPGSELQSLADIGKGLHELAASVKSVQPELAKAAYQKGLLDGGLLAAVALILVFLFWRRG